MVLCHTAERFRAVHLVRHKSLLKPVLTGYNVNVITTTYLIFRGEIFHSVFFCDQVNSFTRIVSARATWLRSLASKIICSQWETVQTHLLACLESVRLNIFVFSYKSISDEMHE